MKVPCPQCGTIRELNRDRGALCRKCAIANRRAELNPRGLDHKIVKNKGGRSVSMYLRVCSCGDKKWVGYIPREGQECQKCSSSKLGYAMSQNNIKEDLIRHFRICPHCPEDDNTIQVQREALGGIRPCRKHKYVDNPEALKVKEAKRVATKKANAKPYKKKPRKKAVKKAVSKKAIEKARQMNREHKASLKVVPKPIPQRLTDEQMVAKFLKKNKPSVVVNNNIPIPHMFSGNIGSGTSVMGG